MGIQPTKMQLYGKPQGNEMVYGKDIIRQVDTFEFVLIDRFKTNAAANMAYQDWMDEYSEYEYCDGEKK